ncbi:amidohydrolase family protein [Burkholderia sp. PAMC 26561]|uniref:amidohydrolase family protein n=1 Tax=Burkholderia sp. PAMC 26561 TaxID=1795043 RepID=UPI00076B58A8|nr:amidohydrolase family protein [Burkholderia sp. PAMC 26561]AME26992.1 amidohydrolase [Burkholderia sp. PAMC 26561]AME27863.1 amidohydrolase [Burkholderia sp. PAMC 26561]
MTTKTQQRILFKGATVLTMDRKLGDFTRGDVLVEGDKIAAVGVDLQVGEAQVIEASDAIVLPGFVDAHRHAWQGTLRRLMPNVDTLGDYIDATHFTLGKFYRPEDMYIGNLLTALSCLDSGTTTVVDASHNARSPEHTDACIDALQEAGLRALHMPGRPLAGSWAEHWPHDLERLKAERFASDDQLLTLGIFCQPDPTIWALASRVGLRTLSEFLDPMAPMLDQMVGLLNPSNIFNHCTSLPDSAWQVFADAGVSITVDPRSDAQYALAGGVFAYQAAIDHGLRPGIGTDLETAYGGDMFSEMRVAFSLQRAIAQSRRYQNDAAAPSPVTVRSILEAATIDGARCAGLDHRIGSLTPGKQADLILIRTDNISLFPSNNAFGTVVHAADRSHVDAVMVAGHFRKFEGKLVDVDQGKVRRAAEASLSHLFEAAGYNPDVLEEKFPQLAGEKPQAWTGK